MEIIERAKGIQDGEIVSWNESDKNVQEECIRRGAKAGCCDSSGELRGAGKGDRFRPINKKRYDANYERIFGKK